MYILHNFNVYFIAAVFWLFTVVFILEMIFVLGAPFELWHQIISKPPISLRLEWHMGLPTNVVRQYLKGGPLKNYSLNPLLDGVFICAMTASAHFAPQMEAIPFNEAWTFVSALSLTIFSYIHLVAHIQFMKMYLRHHGSISSK